MWPTQENSMDLRSVQGITQSAKLEEVSNQSTFRADDAIGQHMLRVTDRAPPS